MVLNMYDSLKYSWWLSGYIYNNLIAASQFLYIRDVDVDPTGAGQLSFFIKYIYLLLKVCLFGRQTLVVVLKPRKKYIKELEYRKMQQKHIQFDCAGNCTKW